MTVQNCIDYVDAMEPNAYSDVQKARWVEECEGIVWTRAFLLQPIAFPDRPPWEMLSAELGLPAPHDKVYTRYLQAQIHYANGEYERYANSMQMYNAAWSELMQWLGGDINISDKVRNRRITIPVEPAGTTQLLVHVPEGCCLIGGRLSVTKGFGRSSGLFVYGSLWVGDEDNVISNATIDLTKRGDVRLPMIVADRGGETVGITTSVEDNEGVAFLTGILAITDEELFYKGAEVRLPVVTIQPAEVQVITVNFGSISSLPAVVEHSAITGKHEVIAHELSNPYAQSGTWNWQTEDGSLVISGSIVGQTNLEVTLAAAKQVV